MAWGRTCKRRRKYATSNMSYPKTKSNSRVVLVQSSVHPNNSAHWQSLSHHPSDRHINTKAELIECLRQDLATTSTAGGGASSTCTDSAQLLAKWSCISGYCEALTTHKDEARRYCAFPVPIDAINRMIQSEFVDWIKGLNLSPTTTSHREAAKAISNAVWKRVISKPSVRDELHANSSYVCLRGSVDNKSLDCFGAAIVTIAALQVAGYTSYLALSEDHAYESHPKEVGETNPSLGDLNLSTCEIAIPGNQKAQQEKRGKEISETFTSNVHRQSTLSPQTSWLYMAANPIICKTVPMALAAIFGNINCQIEKKQGKSISSDELYAIKRDLLWVLHDGGHLDTFPFALSELGDCEENVTSDKGLKELTLPELENEEILAIEKLFIDSILVSRQSYNDAQIYPYCYAGHYHKDAGRETKEEEYRLVEAVRLYSLAAKVASGYVYEVTDSLQLNKTMTKIAELLAEDILLEAGGNNDDDGKSKPVPRHWSKKENAVALGTWLLAFFDSLLFWEEKSLGEGSDGKRFVEILNPSHKHGINKLFSYLDQDIRSAIVSKIYDRNDKVPAKVGDGDDLNFLDHAITETKLKYFINPRSRLASKGGPLAIALGKKKVAIGDVELAIPGPEGGRRRRKKARVD